jgi:hypothetical protein
MRAHPAFQITLRRFGAWRAAVWAVSGAASLTLVAWALSAPQVRSPWWLGLCALGLGAVLWLSVSLARISPMSLRWDGQLWHLGPADAVGNEPWPGQLTVCIDLGAWMLLRFRHTGPGPRPRVSWLPVQRSGRQPYWHALRCALYSPRPAASPGRDVAPES